MARIASLAVAAVPLAALVLAACSSGGGSTCTAGAVECRGTGSVATCAADGSAWAVAECALGTTCGATGCAPIACPANSCPDGFACKDGTCVARSCAPGEKRCTPYSRQVETCNAGGTGWDAPATCPSGQTCDNRECRAVVCQDGEKRCSADGSAIETCRDPGTAWDSAACFGANVCEDGGCKPKVCEPGLKRCRLDNFAVERCSDRGTAWAELEACPGAHACEDATCRPLVCDANAWTCAEDFRSRWQCNAGGTAELPPEACAEGTSCRDRECRPVICVPGSATCTPDAVARLTCDPTGTRNDLRDDCPRDQACVKGACAPAFSPLGEVAMVRADQGPVVLTPGLYAVAVMDADRSDATIPFPLTLSGYVKDPPYSMQSVANLPQPQPPAPWRCGTPRMLRDLPRPRAVPLHLAAAPLPRQEAVGDTRTFLVIAPNGWEMVERDAILRLQGDLANFWEDVTDLPAQGTLTNTTLKNVGDRLDKGVFARDLTLYGQPTDVDGNARIDVLFTNLLPTSNAAAYVYPVTLFPPGSLPYPSDHGEIVYSMRPGGDYSDADMAGIIAHETAHLLVTGRRIAPWLSHIEDMPEWVLSGDAYLGEGLAETAHAWSGQSVLASAYYALQAPSMWRIGSLLSNNYYDDLDLNSMQYGVAALAVGYLFLQAGGVEATGPATLVDLGGLEYLAATSDREEGFPRMAPLDGRSEVEWYADLGAALLLTSLPGAPGPVSGANPRYRFPSARYDTWFGGFNGLPIEFQSTPVLQRVPFSSVVGSFAGGGASFFTALVFGEATATVSRPTSTAVFVRYAP